MLPRHSQARAAKISRLKAADAPKPRPRLNEEQTRQLTELIHEKFGFQPKDFQIAAIKAQIEGVDMIVQASTGAGKTAIAAGPHLWPGNEKKFTIMTCPLLSLEEEMVQSFQTDYGLTAIALNSKNGACDPEKLNDILALKYQIILISPEMLQSRTFHNRVLRNPVFMRNMISMFVDEAHCIVHWGADFRKKYGTLGKLRVFFPRGTPIMAVSATLTPRVVRAVHRSLYFTQSDAQWRFVNKGNDRPNVSLVVRACEHTLNSYADLDFIIPPELRDPSDIPKTYLYVNTIATGGEIIDHVNALICTRLNLADGPQGLSRKAHKRLRGIVRPFNATLSSTYRTRAMDRFRSGRVRILVCTDAAGMGCNIPDVDRVVQWKLPATFSHWIQHAGRAARGPGRTGIAVLLVERSVYNIDLLNDASASSGSKPSKTKTKKTQAPDTTSESATKRDPQHVREYALAHGLARGGSSKTDQLPTGEQPPVHEEDADEGLQAFVQSTVCRRKAWAAAFESGIADPIVPCCDICDPKLLDQTRPPALPPDKRAKALKRGEPDLVARQKLYTWRETTYVRDHRTAQYDDTGVLRDELVDTLVSHGPLSPDQVAGILKDKWVFWVRHGSELSTLVESLEIKFKALPPKTRRTGKKDSSTLAPPSEDANQLGPPPVLGVQPLPIPGSSRSHAVPLEAQLRGPSFGLSPTQLTADSIPSYPPLSSESHHAHSLHASQPPPPLYQPSLTASYRLNCPLPSSSSTIRNPQEYRVVPAALSSLHAPHALWSHVPAQSAPSRVPTPMTHLAHSAPSTSVHSSHASAFTQVYPHLHYMQPVHQHSTTASHTSPVNRANDIPHTDTAIDYHQEYLTPYTAYPSQARAARIPSQPSAMLPPAPHPQSQESASPQLLGSYSDQYPTHSHTQYHLSRTQYNTTYITTPLPSQETTHAHSAPPPMPASSHSEDSDAYYPIPEQYNYMQY